MLSKCLRLVTIVLAATLVSACASDAVESRLASLEGQIQELQQRVDALAQSRSAHAPPTQVLCVDPADMSAQVKSLRAKRDRLALSYTDAHPDITDLDKQIERLEQRLKTSKGSGASCDPAASVSGGR